MNLLNKNNNMKRKLKNLLYVAAVLLMSVSCKKEDRTTVVFGTVKDDLGKPIAGLEVELWGVKSSFAGKFTFLKTSKTDMKGEYSITTEIPKDYNFGNLKFSPDEKILDKYNTSVSTLYFNGNETRDCCSVSVGQKSQYDLVLFRK
ncbi:MAG: hypothetical protein EAZ14_04685 [Runella slithyformis]|nr:MAG: hypothetical protein EAZ14_04685 [Runella slithyformis]